jgi:putative permease
MSWSKEMNTTLRTWLHPYFSNPERLNLWVFLLFIVAVFGCFGGLLAPVMVSVVLAYLLQWPISFLQRLHFNRVFAVLLVYTLFMSVVIGLCVLIIPILLRQLQNLLTQLPQLITRTQTFLFYLHERYPHYISAEQIQNLTGELKQAMNYSGQWIVSTSLTSIPDIIAISVYLVLVPLLVYFFLMDQQKIIDWLVGFLPQQRRLITEVWTEVYTKTGHYVRGKAVEIFIVWIITSLTFAWMQLPYSMLLGLLTGVSVIIPYIGAFIVTIPIVTVGFLEWGWSREFAYLLGAYGIITVLDAHLLFPLLFAEAMSLHPVAIMIATLVFGGLLGFWGVFFSIPLAVLARSLLSIIKHQTINLEQL